VLSYLGKASGVSWLLRQHDRPFDLGPSLTHRDWTVNEILAAGLPVSIALGLLAILLACGIGLAAGVIGGARPGSAADLATLLVALVGVSLPSFVIGTALLVVFGVWLRLVPVGEWGGLSAAILPALTLSLPFAAYIARLTRFGMIDELAADYVRTARAKGVPERRVVLKHALKNAFLPVLSYLGPAAAMALTGSFVVEKIFAVPGIGTHFVNAVLSKDLTLIMGVVLVYSTPHRDGVKAIDENRSDPVGDTALPCLLAVSPRPPPRGRPHQADLPCRSTSLRAPPSGYEGRTSRSVPPSLPCRARQNRGPLKTGQAPTRDRAGARGRRDRR
jgi:ABC-type dipeptide/oligopeptide/nickel transport system permease component